MNDERVLKDCFGSFATGVVIATTQFYDKFYGLTINSFSSLSLNPPLLLFSIDNKSSNLEFFKKSNFFSLSILSNSQMNLAKEFAKPQNDKKWEAEPFFLTKNNMPIFSNSLSFFECEMFKNLEAGDHHIIIGKIINCSIINKKLDPLLYFSGNLKDL